MVGCLWVNLYTSFQAIIGITSIITKPVVVSLHFSMAKSPPRSLPEYFLSVLVLTILLIYSYALVFEIPYPGFDFDTEDGAITGIFTIENERSELQVGDKLLQVNAVTMDDYIHDKRQSLFLDVQPGDTVALRIQRGQQEHSVLWVIPEPRLTEIVDRLTLVWLPYLFWLAGTATLFLVRPKDLHWRLFSAFNYLTAIWLVAGLVSPGAIWQSAIVMRMVIWLCLPVYLHLHWVFPRPLRVLPGPFWWSSYIIAVGLAGLQWFQWLPSSAYLYSFALAVVGSVAFLLIHAFIQPDQRSALKLFGITAAVIFLPIIAVGFIASILQTAPTWLGWGVLLGLPAIPGAYFYTIYRRQLGGLELRANRIITIYLFLILLGTALVVVIPLADALFPNAALMISVVTAILVGFLTIIGFPRFAWFVDHRLLGVPLPPTELLQSYAARIATSLNATNLIHLLRDEILPSLLVRQSALLRVDDGDDLLLIYSEAVPEIFPLVTVDLLALLGQIGENYSLLPDVEAERSLAWIRLSFPLEVEGKLIGYWLLGSRDPDDFYAQSEISILKTISHQVAIALVNIAQAERLRTLYQINVERQEDESRRLARDLHDEVLNQLANLAMHMETEDVLSIFQDDYDVLTARIRRMVGGLRPAMLIYGLEAALEELVDDLSDRVSDGVIIQADLLPSGRRFNPKVEEHLFRIVQQACENALKHAQAKQIRIHGRLEPDVFLVVEDDGIGFPHHVRRDFNQLLADKHFGLAGIQERAALIAAQVKIETAPNHGTRVSISWVDEHNISVDS